MGDVLPGDGLQLSEKRVKAIVDAPEPKNQSEVRSFQGSSQFCAKLFRILQLCQVHYGMGLAAVLEQLQFGYVSGYVSCLIVS